MAVYSRKTNKVEITYEIHDKEILAIIFVFKKLYPYLEGVSFTISIYSHYTNLQYLTMTKVLNPYQVR
jgi:hypothetical protein